MWPVPSVSLTLILISKQVFCVKQLLIAKIWDLISNSFKQSILLSKTLRKVYLGLININLPACITFHQSLHAQHFVLLFELICSCSNKWVCSDKC